MLLEFLAEAAYEILKREGQLHYREILKKLEEGEYDVSEQATIDGLYNFIYNEIRKQGEHSRFKRVGRAIFCASDTFDPATMREAKPNKSKLNPERELRVIKVGPRICGNCTFIEFSGIQEATLRDGVCSRYTESGRVGVHTSEEGCPLWRRMSDHVRHGYRLRQIELQSLVKELNIAVQKKGAKIG